MTSDMQIHKAFSISLLQTAAFFVYAAIIIGVVIILDNRLPGPVTLDNEVKNPELFVAERAHKNLQKLTENGSRVVGSYENEIGAVNFLYNELVQIRELADIHKNLDIDIQTVSGSYYLDFKPFGAYNVYSNVQNVIAKIHASNFSKHNILINAHFDSVPTSPGGSDDGIMCVVMLEVIRKICQWNGTLKYNLIFLFNGAEESPLQASHGFITQHKWAKDVKAVINLEAAGSGGKAILFQSGPGHAWLLNYYSKVPHPYGQVAGEEIFQSNLVPSDTDFRIFRDYGGAVGFDFAFFKNGYRYHTKFDTFEDIPMGSYQHIGDNILELLKSIGSAPEIQYNDPTYSKAVYFDVLGFFMIHYQQYIGTIVNLLFVLFSGLVAYKSFRDFNLGRNWKTKIYLIVTAIVLLVGWVCAIAGVLSIGFLLDICNFSMSWYGSPYLILGLYGVPTVMFSCLPLIAWNYYNSRRSSGYLDEDSIERDGQNNTRVSLLPSPSFSLFHRNSTNGLPLLTESDRRTGLAEVFTTNRLHFSTRVQSQLQSSIVRLIWTVILLVLTCLGMRSAYALMIPVAFNTVGSLFVHLTRLHHSANGWKITYILVNIFPSIMLIYQTITVLSLFIPITGRIGNDKNADIIVGVMFASLIIIISSFYIHFVTLMKRPLWLIYVFFATFLIHVAIVVSPLGFPYTGNPVSPAPQRFMIYHTSRTFEQEGVVKQDSGYFVVNLDRRSPKSVIPYVRQFEKRVPLIEDCKNFLVCGLPLSTPRMLAIMETNTWIPAEQPVIEEDISLHLNSKTFQRPNILSYYFTATGPDHFNIYLSPKLNIRLLNTSFDSIVPENVPIWNNRPIYFVNYVWGVSKAPLNFRIDLEVPKNWNGTSIEIGISGKGVHDARNRYTVQFRSFLDDFPKWADIIRAVANFKSWEM